LWIFRALDFKFRSGKQDKGKELDDTHSITRKRPAHGVASAKSPLALSPSVQVKMKKKKNNNNEANNDSFFYLIKKNSRGWKSISSRRMGF